jgi:hypothetical protein
VTSAHGILSRTIHTVPLPLPYHKSCYTVHMHADTRSRSTTGEDDCDDNGTKCNSGVKPRLSTII